MKKNILNNFLIVILILSVVIFIYPGLILGDSSKPGNSPQVVSNINDQLIRENSLSKFDSSFFPILITSIVIIGILLFAIWQIFRSKRQF
jgi:predicted permease